MIKQLTKLETGIDDPSRKRSQATENVNRKRTRLLLYDIQPVNNPVSLPSLTTPLVTSQPVVADSYPQSSSQPAAQSPSQPAAQSSSQPAAQSPSQPAAQSSSQPAAQSMQPSSQVNYSSSNLNSPTVTVSVPLHYAYINMLYCFI